MKPTGLRVGESGELVAALHQRLKELGFEVPQAEIDRRFFGPATRQAVRSWQIQKELNPSGVVDPASQLLTSESNAGFQQHRAGDLDLELGHVSDHPTRVADEAAGPPHNEPGGADASPV